MNQAVCLLFVSRSTKFTYTRHSMYIYPERWSSWDRMFDRISSRRYSEIRAASGSTLFSQMTFPSSRATQALMRLHIYVYAAIRIVASSRSFDSSFPPRSDRMEETVHLRALSHVIASRENGNPYGALEVGGCNCVCSGSRAKSQCTQWQNVQLRA